MSGPKALAGVPIEGSYQSHQVPLASPTKSDEQFELLKAWLESYGPNTIFSPESNVLERIDKYVIPSDPQKRMGQRKETNPGHHPIDIPDWPSFAQEKGGEFSSTKLFGKYMAEVFKRYATSR
jgi:xylulose-5-phosphate/fructose-6-phosphate phosphoketolase